MSKHTPGPWFVTERNNNFIDICHPNKEKGAITMALCKVQARPSWLDEATANARLISAAPELLEALDKIMDTFDLRISNELREFANNAIKKATGGRMISLTNQIALIKRELHAKEISYPHLVASGKMRHWLPEDDIATMRAVVETLEQVRVKEAAK